MAIAIEQRGINDVGVASSSESTHVQVIYNNSLKCCRQQKQAAKFFSGNSRRAVAFCTNNPITV